MADKRMPIEEFLSLYYKAHEEGMTRDEFAKSIGVKSNTVYQRVYDLRRDGLDIPALGTNGRTPMIDRARAFVESRGSSKAAEKVKVKERPAATEERDPLADILG